MGAGNDLTARERELLRLRNLGLRTLGYLRELGVGSVEELARQEADDLYVRLQRRHGVAFDACLHDLFTAIVEEARGGPARPWHAYTPARRQREADGAFGLRAPGPPFGKG